MNKGESKVAFKNIENESSYNQFIFSNTDCENKIEISYENSMDLNIENLNNKYDLIFIDGGHTYSVIKNDWTQAENIYNAISDTEHKADDIKMDFRIKQFLRLPEYLQI